MTEQHTQSGGVNINESQADIQGDIAGRGKIIHGDEVHGDKVEGGKIGGHKVVVRDVSDGAQVTVTVQGENVRDKELAYLDGLLKRYEYWLDHYTPLAGIAEVRAAVKDGPRLDLPMPFIPPGFEKLVEHGFGAQTEVRRVPVDDLRQAVAEHKRIILLGEPGAGKTTTLWRLAYDYATAAREDGHAPLPVLVPLGGYTDDGPFEAYLARHLGPLAPYLETYRASARLILLLDGLNEMPQAGYEKRVRRIGETLNRQPGDIVVVTCRALDYAASREAGTGLKGLQKVNVSPLDEARIRAFLHNYVGETAGERLFEAMGGKERRSSWQKPSPLLELGRNPYMLLMTAQVYAAAGELPANRARLLGAFVDTLLAREKERRGEKWIETEVQKAGLSTLAYTMQGEGEYGTTIERAWALEQLGRAKPGCDDAGWLLHLAASASLVDVEEKSVRFYHQLLQEYFAARYIVDNASQGSLEDLIKDHLTDERWREVFLLTACLLNPTTTDLFFTAFRHAITELVHDDEGIVALLGWLPSPSKARVQALARAIELARNLAYDLDLDLELGRFRNNAHSIDLDRALELTITIARDLDFGLNHDHAIELAHDFNLDLGLARALVATHDLDLGLDFVGAIKLIRDFDRDLDLDLDYVIRITRNLAHNKVPWGLTRALELSQDNNLPSLTQALGELDIPSSLLTTGTELANYVDSLQAIIYKHHSLWPWLGLSFDQSMCLIKYLQANHLLLECLDLANPPNRTEIENSLLLPPPEE